MCEMRCKGAGPCRGRLLERNYMCKLPTKSSSLRKILRFLQKREKIIEGKHKRKVSCLETRRIVGTYMGESSYASVVRRADRTNVDKKYKTLVEKLI